MPAITTTFFAILSKPVIINGYLVSAVGPFQTIDGVRAWHDSQRDRLRSWDVDVIVEPGMTYVPGNTHVAMNAAKDGITMFSHPIGWDEIPAGTDQ